MSKMKTRISRVLKCQKIEKVVGCGYHTLKISHICSYINFVNIKMRYWEGPKGLLLELNKILSQVIILKLFQ